MTEMKVVHILLVAIVAVSVDFAFAENASKKDAEPNRGEGATIWENKVFTMDELRNVQIEIKDVIDSLFDEKSFDKEEDMFSNDLGDTEETLLSDAEGAEEIKNEKPQNDLGEEARLHATVTDAEFGTILRDDEEGAYLKESRFVTDADDIFIDDEWGAMCTPCTDESKKCAGWAKKGYCTRGSYTGYIKKKCCATCKIPGIEPQCPIEKGFCVMSNGWDQNGGVVQLNSLDGDSAQEQTNCLKLCRVHTGATGCEVIWNQGNRGCYVHTSAVARGNGANNHMCWVFSKCHQGITPCTDKNEKCAGWAKNGYCTKGGYDSYMKKNCCATCKSVPCTPCTDKNKQLCAGWAKKGYCTRGSYVSSMKKNCCATCKKRWGK